MTILSAMQSAALRLVGTRPSVFFSSNQQFEQELVDLVNEAATDICKYNDWQSLISIQTFNGDGITEDFDLPDGYDRMMLTSEMQDMNNWVWGYENIPSIDNYLWLKERGFGPYPGVWTIYDNKFHFYPAPAVSQTATFPYITKNYAQSDSNENKPAFTADTDKFRVRDGERLLTLWIIWRWRENKKLDYTGDQENFEKAIDELAAKDKGSKVYRSGTSRSWGRTYPAWPYSLG